MRTGLVVKYAQVWVALLVAQHVHAVNTSAGQYRHLLPVHIHVHLHVHVLLHGLHRDGSMALVPSEQVHQVSLHHAAYQYVLATEFRYPGVCLELLVYYLLQAAALVCGVCREVFPGDDVAPSVRHYLLVHPLCRVVEYGTHQACVDAILGIGFHANAAYAGQVELHGAIQIAVYA